jgi:hypothetical protein
MLKVLGELNSQLVLLSTKIWHIFELDEKNNDFKLEKIQFLPATAPNAKEPLICKACCAAGGICKPVPIKE